MSPDPLGPASPEELDRIESVIAAWLERQLVDNESVVAVQADPEADTRRWMVRIEGFDKPVFTVWFDLRQRALHAETHLLPAPLEPPAPLYEYLLRANEALRGVRVSVGGEDAVYLRAEVPIGWLDENELDRVLGSLAEATERLFVSSMRLAFGDRFTR